VEGAVGGCCAERVLERIAERAKRKSVGGNVSLMGPSSSMVQTQ
jgi:hypothetical protein